MIKDHLNKDNLHHAYLLEGNREELVSEILSLLGEIKFSTIANPDFCHIALDSLKMEEALNLRQMAGERSSLGGKKIFLVCTNSITLDAQHSLLKMFEEPGEDTHFFMIVPETGALLPTLKSRFFEIKSSERGENKEAKEFLSMTPVERINFLKSFLEGDEEGNESGRAKAIQFLNGIEATLYSRGLSSNLFGGESSGIFHHIFKVRKFLRQPGSSVKSMMESVALNL